MDSLERQPHIFLTKADAQSVAIVVGDPARVELFASKCDESREIAHNREYRTFLCKKDSQSFLITSHGVGSSGAAICFNELIAIGVKTLVRAGTCGSLQPEKHATGDLVIVNAAAKEDGVSGLMEPLGMPAIADTDVTCALQRAAKARGYKAPTGITVTSDIFYPGLCPQTSLVKWQQSKADVVEMEISALFVIARHRGCRAGAIVACDGYPLGWEEGKYDPHGDLMKNAKIQMAEITIAAVVDMLKNNL